MAMQGSLWDFLWGWGMIPYRIFLEIYYMFGPRDTLLEEHSHIPAKSVDAEDSTVDRDEMKHWSGLAEKWWDPEGEFALLRGFNTCRIPIILNAYTKHLASGSDSDAFPLRGISIVDVGCGAGFVAEPLAEYGARVTAIDMVSEVIEIAKSHWKEAHGTEEGPDYSCTPLEELARDRSEEFDMVLCLEVLDHVANWPTFLAQCCKLLRPGGCVIFSTLNRSLVSFFCSIIIPEHVLRIVPMNTHHFKNFIKPQEIRDELVKNGLRPVGSTGCMPCDPWARRPRWTDIPYEGACFAITAVKG